VTERVDCSVQDGRAAVEKACELLTAFSADGDRAFGVTELARRAGMTKSTAHRHLGILQRANMIERSGRGYRVGPGLRALGRAASDGGNGLLADALLPYLVELHAVTRRTVQLAVLEGTEVVYIGKVASHQSVAVPSRVGASLPAHCTAGGKLLLAHNHCLAAELMAKPLRRMTRYTTGTHAQLRLEFNDIRRRGLAVDCGGADVRVSCIAAAILSPFGEPMAAMSVCAQAGANVVAVSEVLVRITQAASRHFLRTPG